LGRLDSGIEEAVCDNAFARKSIGLMAGQKISPNFMTNRPFGLSGLQAIVHTSAFNSRRRIPANPKPIL
jgi:hypothetical protein